MIDIARLIRPDDDFTSAFPGLGFTNRFTVQTAGERIVVCDPNHLADVYNSKDETASLIRQHGVFLMDFGGDSSSAVYWKEPFVLFPLSNHLPEDAIAPPGAELWAKGIV